MTSARRIGATIAVLAVALVGLASCGVSPRHTINSTSAASQIATQLRQHYGGNPTVTCPSGILNQKNQTFTCNAELEGQPLPMNAIITSGSHFSVSPGAAIVVVSSVVSKLTANIFATYHVTPVVTCGNRSLLVKARLSTFYCQATFPGQAPRLITVTVENLQGTFEYSLAQASGP